MRNRHPRDLAFIAAFLVAAPLACAQARHDWTQFGFNAARTSASTAPTGIDAKNVATLQRQQVSLDGTVDASVIYLSAVDVKGAPHDAFFLTTTYGKTEAIDAHTGAVLWTYAPPNYDSWLGTYRITNTTPVADPDRRYLYAASPDGVIQKLAVADGRALWRTAITNLPQREKIASSLNFDRGRVLAVVGGYVGDEPPYQGHVAILSAASGKLLHVWNALCSDRHQLLQPASCPEQMAAIWGRAGAVVDPGTGDILVATGNGKWDGHAYWGDAFIALDRDATRMVANYTPTDTAELDQTDADIGSTSPVPLGDGIVAQGGKDGKIRLLDLKTIAGAAPHQDHELQAVPTPGSTDLFTAPAYWRGPTGAWLFVADNRGTAAWQYAKGRLQPGWSNDRPGTSPVWAGGLLYVYDPHDGGLYVYEPTTGRQLTVLACGHGHWNSPIVVNGMVALPEGNANRHQASGVLDIWRLPSH